MNRVNTNTNERDALPSSWSLTRLVEIARVESGYGFPIRYQGESNGDLPFFKVGDISNTVLQGRRYMSKANNYVSHEVCKKLKATPLKKGTIVFARIGEAIKLNRRAILSQDSLIDNNVAGVFCYLNKLYLYYYLLTIKFGDYSRATTVPSVRKTDIEEIEVPIPPLSEQDRIVTKLDDLFTKLDAGIEYLKKTRIMLKQYRQSVMKYAFEGKLTELWRVKHTKDVESISEFFERIRNNIKFNEYAQLSPDIQFFPNAWITTKLGAICELISGQHVIESDYNKLGKGMPYLTGPSDFTNLYPVITKWTEKPKAIAKKNDVLVTVKGAGVGKVNILNINEATISRQLMAIRVKFRPLYVYYYLLYNFYKLQKLGLGSTVPGIDRDSILNVQFPLSCIEEQDLIVSDISNKFSLIDKSNEIIEFNLKFSERLRQSILVNAYQGRLIPQDPSDEPSQITLQRIKSEKLKVQTKPKGRRFINKPGSKQKRII